MKGGADTYALYVNFKTTLLESYRHLYPDVFRYEGQRALLFSAKAPPPEAPLRQCVALALTYHRSKRTAV